MEGDGRGNQDRRMPGTSPMPRSGPGMSDSEVSRLNVSLGMLDPSSLLAAQALHAGASLTFLCRMDQLVVDPDLEGPAHSHPS